MHYSEENNYHQKLLVCNNFSIKLLTHITDPETQCKPHTDLMTLKNIKMQCCNKYATDNKNNRKHIA